MVMPPSIPDVYSSVDLPARIQGTGELLRSLNKKIPCYRKKANSLPKVTGAHLAQEKLHQHFPGEFIYQ